MIPFGSIGSFQFKKILSSKGVPFNDFVGTGPGTAKIKLIVYNITVHLFIFCMLLV